MLGIQQYSFLSHNIRRISNITKNRTEATKTAQVRCVRSIDSVFMTSVAYVLLFRFIYACLMYYRCIFLIWIHDIRISTESSTIPHHRSRNNSIWWVRQIFRIRFYNESFLRAFVQFISAYLLFVFVLLLLGYVIFKYILNQKQHHNKKYPKLHQLSSVHYCDFAFKKCFVSF